jgi:tellurite resistance protein TehA-like permease
MDPNIAHRWNGGIWAPLGPTLRDLHPSYFAMVMATGIVSIGCHLLQMADAARLLFWLNVPAYLVISGLFVARAILFTDRFLQDLGSHARGPGFFTAVAATCVVGLQFVVIRGDLRVGYALWWLGMVLWALCTYAIFVLLSIREEKPSLADGIHGGWLVAVVSTQSVCILGCRVLPDAFGYGDGVFLFLVSLWLCGGMLYIWMISLIFYRYMFFRFSPADLMPPYWINMGAVAISTVAGTALSSAAQGGVFVVPLLPFVHGLTLLFWATATWWIPMLLILGVWRHHARGYRITYDPLYWGLVFPIGMYAVATIRLGQVFAFPFLPWVARAFITAALCAWLLTFLGMTARILRLVLMIVRGDGHEHHRRAVHSEPVTLRSKASHP